MRAMDLQGPLWEGVLPGVLRRIYVGRRTGVLTLARETERRKVRFHVGNIANAETNVQADRLGDLLVRHGVIADADFKRATGTVLRENKKLGRVLIELGLLNQDSLREALAAHVDVVLSKVFAWSEGHYEFRDEMGRVPDVDELTLPFSTGDLILRASRSVADPDVVRYHLGDMARGLAFSRDPLLRFQRLNLTAIDGLVLSRVDGVLTAKQIVELLRMPPDEVRSSLFALLNTGVVEYMAKAGDTVSLPSSRALTPAERSGPAQDRGGEGGAVPPAAQPEAEPQPPPSSRPQSAPAAAAPAAARGPAGLGGRRDPATQPEPAVPPPAPDVPASLGTEPGATVVLEPGFSLAEAAKPGEPEYSTSPRGEPAIVLNRHAPEDEQPDEPVEWLPLPDIDVAAEVASGGEHEPSRSSPRRAARRQAQRDPGDPGSTRVAQSLRAARPATRRG